MEETKTIKEVKELEKLLSNEVFTEDEVFAEARKTFRAYTRRIRHDRAAAAARRLRDAVGLNPL